MDGECLPIAYGAVELLRDALQSLCNTLDCDMPSLDRCKATLYNDRQVELTDKERRDVHQELARINSAYGHYMPIVDRLIQREPFDWINPKRDGARYGIISRGMT